MVLDTGRIVGSLSNEQRLSLAKELILAVHGDVAARLSPSEMANKGSWGLSVWAMLGSDVAAIDRVRRELAGWEATHAETS